MARVWWRLLTAAVAGVVALAAVLTDPVLPAAVTLTAAESPAPAEDFEVQEGPDVEAVPAWGGRGKARAGRPRSGPPSWAVDLPDAAAPAAVLHPPAGPRPPTAAAPRFLPPSPDLLTLVQRFTC